MSAGAVKLWAGEWAAAGRAAETLCLLSHPPSSSVHNTPPSHIQILQLTATGNGERWHQIQGRSFRGLHIKFMDGCSLFFLQISGSVVLFMSAGDW